MSRRGSQSSRGVSRNRRNVFSRAFMKTAQGFDFRKEACKVGVGKAVKVEVEREGKKCKCNTPELHPSDPTIVLVYSIPTVGSY